MGEASPLKVGVARPRPLGLVKRESIHFEDVEASSNYGLPYSGKNLPWSPRTLVELSRSKTESDIKRDLKSMRDLQETLRQAALLNIVAAVNHEERAEDSLPPTRAAPGSQSVGIKGASILGHSIPAPASKLLVSSAPSEVANIGHFSHNLQSSSTTAAQNMPSGSQNVAITQILSQRPRTISIPRPRTQQEQGSFMHKSLLDAKEKLTGITTFRSGYKKEGEYSTNQEPSQQTSQNEQITEIASESKSSVVSVEPNNKEYVRAVSCIRGNGFDSNEPGINIDTTPKQNGAADLNEESQASQNAKSKEEQRAHNVHQMQVVKRHISTTKKKEIMKKLTDIAKCEAVDMAVPLSSEDPSSAPPIIIMSQQKEHSPTIGDFYDTRVNRTKSMTSLNSRAEEQSRVPSNTRVQSETIDALLNHQAKKKESLNLEEDLRIESLNGHDKRHSSVDGFYRAHRDSKMNSMDNFTPNYSNPLSQEPFFMENVGRSLQPSNSPDFLELRPLEGSPVTQHRVTLNERRRPPVSRRAVIQQHTRDKLISPSPVVYEASFHRPKASMGQISLVGQSVPCLSDIKQNQHALKQPAKKGEGNSQAGMNNKKEETTRKSWSDPKSMSLRHWGSTAKPPTDSPILRTEILDHLQCVGLVNHRPQNNITKKFSKFKSSSLFHSMDLNRSEEEFFDEDFDDDDSSGTPVALKNTPQYRRSKLYNAFRASEENLSNLVDSSCIETETMTGKSLLSQTSAILPIRGSPPPSSRDPTMAASKEPLYMGCSSRVSENDLRSQFHYVSEADEKEAEKGGSFKVMKAIDQDVYFDFQHKKYRKNADSPMNTAPNKPRMHFLKIKFNGEAKT